MHLVQKRVKFEHIIALLRDKKLSDGEPTETQQWFAGLLGVPGDAQPSELGLMNGDIGITLEVPAAPNPNRRSAVAGRVSGRRRQRRGGAGCCRVLGGKR